MKALSLWQPYASLIACGAKTIETRSWATKYRGPLVILAARKWNADVADDCWRAMDILQDAGFHPPPTIRQEVVGRMPWDVTLGRILACCELLDCRPMEAAPEDRPLDAAFGTFGPGRFGWLLGNVVPVFPTIPHSGRQGLFEIPASVLKRHLP